MVGEWHSPASDSKTTRKAVSEVPRFHASPPRYSEHIYTPYTTPPLPAVAHQTGEGNWAKLFVDEAGRQLEAVTKGLLRLCVGVRRG
ncbi:hypothetical protein SKAU_G00181410 [Synaphobranchus kaupii]|uniref:Uncharacterized protein n=1 Tax=Synaphobranchus kaupii TaxID=118154 RepID=A0A9Q1FMJ5_SYNKA|nr:hypothetical protein SKAU_G00181410 [Synaphobranchus kaupii]